jgi:GNAT superfamily N-acetyltransferase
MDEEILKVKGIRFSVARDGKEVGRAYLYLLKNDLHTKPFGLLEDVFVDEMYRDKGIARELMTAVLKKARTLNCYKLLATSRNDGTRESVHE